MKKYSKKNKKETTRIKKRVILLGMMMALMMSTSTLGGIPGNDAKSTQNRSVRPLSLKSQASPDEVNADLYAQAVTALDEALEDGVIDDALREVKLNVLDQLVEEYALS